MPRYFFQGSGVAPYVDHDGWDLADDEAAWSLAIASTGELLRDLDGGIPDRAEIVTTVTDEAGHAIISLRFSAEKHIVPGRG